MTEQKEKMNFGATWSMAVGGMVGGGIFSVLGVLIQKAGAWFWLSFALAGLLALISAHSYSQLSMKYDEGGGAFIYLRKINQKGFATSLSWILILGYILTISVYAFTFGHYVAHVLSAEGWLAGVLGAIIIAVLTWVNLKGVGNMSKVEIVAVAGKMLVLLGLAFAGIMHWAPEALRTGSEPKTMMAAVAGGATIFMAYQGFELLSYDYEDLKNPRKTLPGATLLAVACVILVYILVALGATMLAGAETIIEQKEVALAIAGKQALGTAGLILVTVAAAFSTGSAINATLFSTARLMENIAGKKKLPEVFTKENKLNIPHYAIISIAVLAAVLAITGSLAVLVNAASLIFLITFGTVNYMAHRQKVKYHLLCLVGAIGCVIAVIVTLVEQIQEHPVPLIIIVFLILLSVVGRPFILKKIKGG